MGRVGARVTSLSYTAAVFPPLALHNHLVLLHVCVQAPWDDVSERLCELGFERGWGRNAVLVREQFRQLLDILQVQLWSEREGR